MSIITDFHSWLARRRTKRRSEDFRRGYDFAFTNLCRGNNTPDDLKAMQTADRTAFDDETLIDFEANARFIAACNPVAIRTMLDRLKAAEGECERLRESLRGLLAVTSSKAPGTGLIVGAEDRHAAAIKQARAALENSDER